jgi:hypothetical protein
MASWTNKRIRPDILKGKLIDGGYLDIDDPRL